MTLTNSVNRLTILRFLVDISTACVSNDYVKLIFLTTESVCTLDNEANFISHTNYSLNFDLYFKLSLISELLRV